ncbi:MAG: AAA family ATPase, partial [Bacteroidaceae bacterium]|nr:AAA family ATPase [Bacteroidaceae bacterium]
MLISKLTINNFRGIKSTTLYPTDHVVLIGDNNVGKTSILEAIDLAMGPDRLNHRPVIDEHDFYAGKYLKEEGETNNPHIYIEVVITNLNEEQQRRFNAELEYWDTKTNDIAHSINDVEENGIPCIRISFDGYYDQEEDNFKGETFFTRGEVEGNK